MMLNNEIEAEVMEGVNFVGKAPKLMDVLNAVVAVYRVGRMDLMSHRRYPYLVEARDAFYWAARHLTPRTYSEIGRFLADRDHSTVWTGIGRCDERLDAHRARLSEVFKRLGIEEVAL